MKDKFFNIPLEKQNKIINSALAEFAKNGYTKTSINDIAKSADVSKASLFYYFNTKKELYLYLYEYCYDCYMKEVEKMLCSETKDFFELFLEHQHRRINLMKRHPEMFLFLNESDSNENEDILNEVDIDKLITRHPEIFSITNGFNSNDDKELNSDLKRLRKNFVDKLITSIINKSDMSKFKEDVDINILLDIMKWVTNGYMRKIINHEPINIALDDYILFLKKSLYK